MPNPCARPNHQQFTNWFDRKSTCVGADNNRFGRRGNGASRISALFPAAAAKILSPPVVFFAEVEKHATRSLAQMQRKVTLSAEPTSRGLDCCAAHERQIRGTAAQHRDAPRRAGPGRNCRNASEPRAFALRGGIHPAMPFRSCLSLNLSGRFSLTLV